MRRFVFRSFLAVILLMGASPVFANFSPMPDRNSVSMLPSIVLLDLASDTFFILVSLLILGQIGKVRLGTVVKVCLLAMVAGFTADAIGLGAASLVTPDYGPMWTVLPARTILVLAVLQTSMILIAAASYALARFCFKLNHRQSLIMGAIMGVCTMPVGVLVAGTAIDQAMAHGVSQLARADAYLAATYAGIGILFAGGDILLLWFLRPISSLNRWHTSVIGLVIIIGASALCFRSRNEERQIMVCSSRMMQLSAAIQMYEGQYGDFPSSLSALSPEYARYVSAARCPLDDDATDVTSYEYRKPPAYIAHPEILHIVRCPQHRLPPGYSECAGRRRELEQKIRQYVLRYSKAPGSLKSLVDDHMVRNEDVYCRYVPSDGRKVEYRLMPPTPEKLKQIRESLPKTADGTGPVYKPGLSAELLEFYAISHDLIHCPLHPSTPGAVECEQRRNMAINRVTGFRTDHGALPSSLEQVVDTRWSSDCTVCPSLGPDGKAVKYVYTRPPADFASAYSYWMLKCTHHPKYDLYRAMAGTAMKALPKGEHYD